MFHYINTCTTEKGDALVGWQVECVQLADGITTVPIFADESGTPIVTVSGIANRALVDDAGNYDFFVPEGNYSLRFYDRTGVSQGGVRYLSMYGAGAAGAAASAAAASAADAAAYAASADATILRSDLAATTGADKVGMDTAGTYAAGTIGKAVKDLYGVHTASAADPAQDGGLIGLAPDGNSTKAAVRQTVSLTGSRTKAKVGLGIEMTDNQSGPASAAGISTADSASYGLSIVNYRPNWNTSGATGETDGINIFIRQASSDAAGLLSNILTRSGFGATLESYTGSADSAGAVVKAVNVQLGVVNSRDGGEYGLIAQATTGTSLSAGISIRESGSATWSRAFEVVNAASSTKWYVRAADGAMFGGTVLPIADAGANIGDASLRYDAAWCRRLYTSPYSVSQLPSASGNQSARAMVTDSTVAASGNFGAVVAGGGSNAVPVYSDGTNWRIG